MADPIPKKGQRFAEPPNTSSVPRHSTPATQAKNAPPPHHSATPVSKPKDHSRLSNESEIVEDVHDTEQASPKQREAPAQKDLSSEQVRRRAKGSRRAGDPPAKDSSFHKRSSTSGKRKERDSESNMSRDHASPSKRAKTSHRRTETIHHDPLSPSQQTEEMERRVKNLRRKKNMTPTASELSSTADAIRKREIALRRAIVNGM